MRFVNRDFVCCGEEMFAQMEVRGEACDAATYDYDVHVNELW